MNQADNIDIESYQEIGALLQVAREQMRMPLNQAAGLLHIRMRYLDALEQGRLQELPGLTYTRGYLQAYASFLGLDKVEILRRFEGVEGSLAKKGIYFPQVFSKQKTPNHSLIWGGLIFALLAYGFWVAILKPPTTKISMVEAVLPSDKNSDKMLYSKDVACLQHQDVLYPPCTTAGQLKFTLLPLHHQIQRTMDLAVKNLAP